MKSNDHKRMGVLLIALLAVLIIGTSAHAQTLNLRPPSLANVHGRLTTRFGVTVEELPILKGELQDGLELELTCNVGLYRNNDYWFDDQITTTSFTSALKYNSLTKEFTMTLPKAAEPLRNADLGRLLTEGWGAIDISLGSWALLDRGEKYTLTLDTAMREKHAPTGIMRVISFWAWTSGSKNSFQLDFTY